MSFLENEDKIKKKSDNLNELRKKRRNKLLNEIIDISQINDNNLSGEIESNEIEQVKINQINSLEWYSQPDYSFSKDYNLNQTNNFSQIIYDNFCQLNNQSTKEFEIVKDNKFNLTIDFIMIVGKYLNSNNDFINLMKVSKKYEELVLMYKFNPISDISLFKNIQTQHFYKRKDLKHKKPNLYQYIHWYDVPFLDLAINKTYNMEEEFKNLLLINNEYSKFYHNYDEIRYKLPEYPIDFEYKNNDIIKRVVYDEKYNKDLHFNLDGTPVVTKTIEQKRNYLINYLNDLNQRHLKKYGTDIQFLDDLPINENSLHFNYYQIEALQNISNYNEIEFLNRNGIKVIDLCFSIKIPEGVYEIKTFDMIEPTDRLYDIEFPKSLRIIRSEAFVGFNLLKFDLDYNVKTEDNSFYDCYIVNPLIVHQDLINIDFSCLTNCIFSIYIPEGITEICDYCFQSNTIENITFPSSLLIIGKSAFKYCNINCDLYFNDNIKYIGEDAFRYSKCCDIQLPRLLKRLRKNTFLGASISCIYFGEELMIIDKFCFRELNNNKPIEECDMFLNSKLVRIGYQAFYKSFITFRWIENHDKKHLRIIDSCCFEKSKTILNNLLFDLERNFELKSFEYRTFAFSNLEYINIPEGVTVIKQECFSYCNKLIDIDFPNSLERIERFCFYKCEGLSEIVLPIGIIIERYAFYGCKKLRIVKINIDIQNKKTFMLDFKNVNTGNETYDIRLVNNDLINAEDNAFNFTNVLGNYNEMIRFCKNKEYINYLDNEKREIEKNEIKEIKINEINDYEEYEDLIEMGNNTLYDDGSYEIENNEDEDVLKDFDFDMDSEFEFESGNKNVKEDIYYDIREEEEDDDYKDDSNLDINTIINDQSNTGFYYPLDDLNTIIKIENDFKDKNPISKYIP